MLYIILYNIIINGTDTPLEILLVGVDRHSCHAPDVTEIITA